MKKILVMKLFFLCVLGLFTTSFYAQEKFIDYEKDSHWIKQLENMQTESSERRNTKSDDIIFSDNSKSTININYQTPIGLHIKKYLS